MFLRIAGVTVGIFLVTLVSLAGIRQAAYRPMVSVRWADDLATADQAGLEERFSLSGGARHDGSERTWSYALADVSRRNVRALVDHPSIADTDGIVRASAEVEGAIGWPRHAARSLPKALGLALVLGAAVALALLLRSEPES